MRTLLLASGLALAACGGSGTNATSTTGGGNTTGSATGGTTTGTSLPNAYDSLLTGSVTSATVSCTLSVPIYLNALPSTGAAIDDDVGGRQSPQLTCTEPNGTSGTSIVLPGVPGSPGTYASSDAACGSYSALGPADMMQVTLPDGSQYDAYCASYASNPGANSWSVTLTSATDKGSDDYLIHGSVTATLLSVTTTNTVSVSGTF